MYFNIPFTHVETYLEYPTLIKAPSFFHFASHRTTPDLTGPGSVLLWVGRFRAVVSYTP